MRNYIGKCTVKMYMAVMVFAFTLTMLFSGVSTTHAQGLCEYADMGSCMQCCADGFQADLDYCFELPPYEKQVCINGPHGANDRFDECRSGCIAVFVGGL
jgi:hypothetical protein